MKLPSLNPSLLKSPSPTMVVPSGHTLKLTFESQSFAPEVCCSDALFPGMCMVGEGSLSQSFAPEVSVSDQRSHGLHAECLPDASQSFAPEVSVSDAAEGSLRGDP